MRSFLVALASSLLLSSNPVFSLKIHSIDVSPSHEGKVASISLYINGKEWRSDGQSFCKTHKKSCHKTTNRYGFQCGKKFYNQAKVLAAAKAACPKISENAQNNVFPASYRASTFMKPGPYVEWPIKRNGKLWNKWSRDKNRIVMTMDCTVVGAVVYHKKSKDYSDCEVRRH